ncbi:MAG: phage tail sheath subtilisin-like domain-containing protein [Geobacteraceae bacterium]|nr:phage tail sheath subtilisin-like domain-containing protein [Geobacteraceae bacterium]
MDESISFDNIPSTIRKPGAYFEFNTTLAVNSLPANVQPTLIVAQRIAAGSVAALTPTRVYSTADAATYFGRGSLAHRMVMAALKANPYLDLTVCALDDGAGAAATGTITIANAATGSGVLALFIGNDLVQIAIANGDAVNAIATALAAAINNLADLPVTASAALGVVTLTARNKGLVANQIDLEATITANIGSTVAVVAMAGGTIDPDIQTALDKVYASQYSLVITPYNDATSLATLRDHLDAVSGPIEQRPGVGYYAVDSSLASAITLATGINSGRMVGPLLRGTRSPSYEIAAAFAAVRASESDPARPLNYLALKGIAAPAEAQRLTRQEQESALANGVAPLQVGPGQQVQIVRAITTYVENIAGVPDISLLDVTTIDTLDYTRRSVRERLLLRFPRAKLSTKTPPRVRTEVLDVLNRLERLEILENVVANRPGVIIVRDEQDPNRLNIRIPADVVNGLHVIAGRIDLIL